MDSWNKEEFQGWKSRISIVIFLSIPRKEFAVLEIYCAQSHGTSTSFTKESEFES